MTAIEGVAPLLARSEWCAYTADFDFLPPTMTSADTLLTIRTPTASASRRPPIETSDIPEPYRYSRLLLFYRLLAMTTTPPLLVRHYASPPTLLPSPPTFRLGLPPTRRRLTDVNIQN